MKNAPLTRLGLMTKVQRRFILAMNQAGARYVVIGGKAMQGLGIHRPTHDLDVWMSTTGFTPNQVHAVLRGLAGASSESLLDRLHKSGTRVALPNEMAPDIDILTSVGDMDFDEMYVASQPVRFGATVFRIPRREDLIRTKEAGINSLTERIVAGVWVATDLEKAQAAVTRDMADIELIRNSGG